MTARRTLVAVAFMVLTACSGGDGSPSSGGNGAPAGDVSTTASAPRPSVVRATGPGACAFLSTDDVRQATSAPQVELRQSMGPNGNPGCEWSLGDERRVLQLEFQPGRAPATLPASEDVAGPWQAARWVAASRTLHIDAKGQALFVRASDNDPARAKQVSVAVGSLAAERI
jgi:hypothetical protein